MSYSYECCSMPRHIEPTIEDLQCCKRIHNINNNNYEKFKTFDFGEIFCHLDARFNMNEKISDEIFSFMIERSVNIEKIYNGNKAIHIIAQYGTPLMIKLMVEKGVDLSMNASLDGGKTQNGWLPIFNICFNYMSTPDLIKYLLDKNINFNVKDINERRPIQFLCKNKNFTVECLNYMISKGVICNYEDKFGEYPVSNACISKNLDVAKYLIEKQNCVVPSIEKIKSYWHRHCSIISSEDIKKIENFIIVMKNKRIL